MLLSLILGLGGLVAVGLGLTKPWFEDRHANQLPIGDLFGGVTRDTASVLTSMVVPLVVVGLLALFGLLVAKGVAQLAGLLMVAISLGWVAQAREAISLGALQEGAWYTVFGSLLVLVGAVAGKSRR